MKLFNRIALFLVICLSAFVLTGCGEKNVEGELDELMAKVYSQLPEDKTPMGLTNIEVTAENVEGFLGTADIEYKEALASEPMVSSIAHSVVLVRVEDESKVEEVMAQIKDNVNPRKWICVGVEEDQVIVKNKGNLIILIMVADGAEELEAGFDGLE
ncbi:MAG: hypothetical protein ACI4WW_04930 [Candidatus Coprovivens sp.]